MLTIWITIAYLLGSMPFGLIVAKIFCKVDPRETGSGNIGATNVARLCGVKFGILVLILDALKGFLPSIIAVSKNLCPTTVSLVALATILGHAFSLFLKFKGGKGLATTIGAFLALMPLSSFISLVTCIVTIAITGYVSLGSLTFAICLPILALFTDNLAYLPLSFAVMLLLLWRHRDNIKRLAHGEEIPWQREKK